MLLLLLQLAFALGAILPVELSRDGNPELYAKVKAKAKSNLKTLPKASRKSYAQLLKENDDILMAYLIAYESDANLAHANAEELFSNYRELNILLNNEGLRYPAEFFLSYVAKQTVSDERLSAYRKAMLDDGLRQVWEGNSDMMERYRATSSWCVEKLKFQQSSGRDQSPLDITQKSLLGRCEEMQILFVAAARTVGLPSRPASTPWWAHIDNNHAWAEVFLDGVWAYTGDMDAAFYPNQTWFSGLIDKTVLILADGSMATTEDEVIAESRYHTVINSTRNYAQERTRKISVQTLDSAGKIVPQAAVSVMVFNWAALRTLATMHSDLEGRLSFSAGRGAFYLSAYKDGQQALLLVNSSDAIDVPVTLTLSTEAFSSQTMILNYPDNEIQWLKAPQSYQDDVAQRKLIWQEQEDKWRLAATTFAPYDSLLQALSIQCRGNLPEWQKFVAKLGTPPPDFMEFLLAADPKFLWQADATQFEALYRHYQNYPLDADYPEQLYDPSTHYEDLSRAFKDKDRWQLYPFKLIQKGSTEAVKFERIMKSLHKRYKINGKKALEGLLRLDVAVQQKYLSNYQFRMLAVSALRANGIAAEYSRIPDQILVYLQEDWQYYDAIHHSFEKKSTDTATRSLKINIRDNEGVPLKIADEQMSLTRFVDGQFYTLNNRFEYLGPGKYQSLIKDTDAYLQFGYRISNRQTAVQIWSLQSWDGVSPFELIAENYPKTWQEADAALLALFDAETLANASVILVGNHDQENSLRILERIKELPYRFYGYAASPNSRQHYSVLDTWQKRVQDDGANLHRSITFIKKDGKWLYYRGLWENLPR